MNISDHLQKYRKASNSPKENNFILMQILKFYLFTLSSRIGGKDGGRIEYEREQDL